MPELAAGDREALFEWWRGGLSIKATRDAFKRRFARSIEPDQVQRAFAQFSHEAG